MKQVMVIRHAPKNINGPLTDAGKVIAVKLKGELKDFDVVISSDVPRAYETAELLLEYKPSLDQRARIPDFTLGEEKELFLLGQKHPAGIAGAIFDNSEYLARTKRQSKRLVELIKETLHKLPENGKAIIFSHDATMVAAEKMLKGQPLVKAERNYQPLSGFSVNENLDINYFSLIN